MPTKQKIMNEKLQNLLDLNELSKSGAISKEEFETLKQQLLDQTSIIEKPFHSPDKSDSLYFHRIKAAGNSLMYVYKLLIYQILLGFIYGFLIGFFNALNKENQILLNIITLFCGLTALYLFMEIYSGLKWAGRHLQRIDKAIFSNERFYKIKN